VADKRRRVVHCSFDDPLFGHGEREWGAKGRGGWGWRSVQDKRKGQGRSPGCESSAPSLPPFLPRRESQFLRSIHRTRNPSSERSFASSRVPHCSSLWSEGCSFRKALSRQPHGRDHLHTSSDVSTRIDCSARGRGKGTRTERGRGAGRERIGIGAGRGAERGIGRTGIGEGRGRGAETGRRGRGGIDRAPRTGKGTGRTKESRHQHRQRLR
jgi:hypothetical protein